MCPLRLNRQKSTVGRKSTRTCGREKMAPSFLSTMFFSKRWKETIAKFYKAAESQNKIMLVSKTQLKYWFGKKMIFLGPAGSSRWHRWPGEGSSPLQLWVKMRIWHQGDTLPYLHFPYTNNEEVKILLLKTLNR